MVALLGLVAPGWRQRAPSASGARSGQVQPWGPSTWVQLVAWLKASATPPPVLALGGWGGGRLVPAAGSATAAAASLPAAWRVPGLARPRCRAGRWRDAGSVAAAHSQG